MKTELRLFGGDLDGLVLQADDDTMTWPLAITFDVPDCDAELITFRRLRYVQWHFDEHPETEDGWSDYILQSSETIKCDPVDPMFSIPRKKTENE